MRDSDCFVGIFNSYLRRTLCTVRRGVQKYPVRNIQSKNPLIWSEISDIRFDFKISDISDRVSRKNSGFSDRIRIGIFQKCQRTRSENPVIRTEKPGIRSENPVIRSEKFGYLKSSDIRKFQIGFGSQISDLKFSGIRIFGSDPLWYPTLNTPNCATQIGHLRRTVCYVRRKSLSHLRRFLIRRRSLIDHLRRDLCRRTYVRRK